MRIIGIKSAVALVLACLNLASVCQSAVAEECGCRFQKARSEASVGTCAVREDMARDCGLIWGMPPGTPIKDTGSSHADASLIIGEIRQAAAQAPSPNAETYAPGISRMSEPTFWNEFQSEVRRRSQLDDGSRADLFDHSLAFLTNAGATSDFRQFTVGALVFVIATNLRQGAMDPSVRREFLLTLMHFRDRLTAFTSGGADSGDFANPTKVLLPNSETMPIKIMGKTVRGCLDIWAEEIGVGSMIKAPWSTAKGRRCE